MTGKFIEPIFDNIPLSLQHYKKWVAWRAEGKVGEKPRKVPYTPYLPNSRASSTNPSTWGTYEQAESAFICGGYAGVGIVLNGDGLVAIDIDGCVTDGKASEAAMALLDELGAQYIEISPSGTGLRALGHAEQLDTGINGSRDGLKAEFYSTARYVTLTGMTVRSGSIGQLKNFKAIAESFHPAPKEKVNPETGETERMTQAEKWEALETAILSSEVYHDAMRDLAASKVQSGIDPDEVERYLHDLMDRSQGPRDERWRSRKAQIKELVRSAAEKYAPKSDEELFEEAKEHYENADRAGDSQAGKQSKVHAFKLLTPAELSARKPPRWMVQQVLPETGTGMVVAPSTGGKTFLALQLGLHVSLGLAWFGIKTRQTPVVYVGLEGESGIQLRVKALAHHYGLTLPDCFRFVLQPLNLLERGDIAGLSAAILHAGGQGGLIFIDTMNRATPGADENMPADMSKIIDAIKKLQTLTGGLVLVVHHMGKNISAGPRGHTSHYGSADVAVAISKEAGTRSWSTSPEAGGKAKDAEPISKSFRLESVPLGLDDEGNAVSSAVVVPCDRPVNVDKPLTSNQRTALSAYYEAAPLHGRLDADGEFAGLHLDHWRPAFFRASTADNDNAKRVAFQRARGDLETLGKLSVENNVYRLEGAESFRELAFADALRAKRGSL